MNKNLDLEYKHEWLQKMADVCEASSTIDSTLFDKYEVKRGLRDLNGQGVLTGLTEISEIRSYTVIDHDMVPCEGKLYYQGIDIEEIVDGFLQEKRFGYEEVVYLLLFGELPTENQLEDLKDILAEYRKSLPSSFVRDIIMKAPSSDLMNTLGRSVLTLYSYDTKADDTTTENVLRQCLELVALLPMFAVYGYQAANYFHEGSSFFLHPPKEEYSTAENILQMLRPNGKYTPLEARVLDAALVLHAEHGGGNNSTFTNHVVTSSGTDTYSAVAASIASLKGPRHGGANLKVQQMFADLHEHVTDLEDDDQIQEYLQAVLRGDAFDHSGLIYGMGHAVYTLSDPREVILKDYAQKLAESKGMLKEYSLYDRVERIGTQLLSHRNHVVKPICANVDFYSGFIYTMLGIPEELFTPIFAISRIAGWSAHRLEELVNRGKIIRPAYKYVGHHRPFVDAKDRGTTEE